MGTGPLHAADALRRGYNSEEKALGIINEFAFTWLKEARRTKHGDYDHRGIDILVSTDRGDIYVQVKSSGGAMRRWRAKNRKRGFDISSYVVIIVGDRERALVFSELREKLERAYEKLTTGQTTGA